MSVPNPLENPTEFLERLRQTNLDPAVTAFLHYQNRPSIHARLQVFTVQEWSDRMDATLVSTVICEYYPNTNR